MAGSCLADRLGRHIELTDKERDALPGLETEHVRISRGGQLVAEGQRAVGPFVVREGWLRSSILLGNGGRQITRLSLSGDLVALSALAAPDAHETISALTGVVLCPIDRARLGTLFVDHPRLAALLFAITAGETAALADRLASIGRTSARARVAHLLCDLFMRLRALDPASDALTLPLTQEEIGDATGLTAVHVNRMMRALVDDKVIERRGNVIRLLSEQRLVAEANCIAERKVLTGWLPPAR